MSVMKELVTVLKFKLEESGIKKYQAALKGAQTEAKALGKNMNDGLQQTSGIIDGIKGKLIGLFSVAAGGALIKSVISTSAEFEKFETILGTIEGSSEKAKSSMGWISEFAAKTPYDIAGVTDAFIKLRAYGMNPIKDDLLRTLGDTSAAMGKPIMQAVEAIADAVTGENERLKEFGIKAAKQAGKIAYTYTDSAGKQQTKLVDANSREQIQATLQAIWNEKYAGAMDKLSSTWEGITSNIGDQFDRLKLEIGRAGVFDGAKEGLKAFQRMLENLDADDLKEIAETLVEIGRVSAFAFSVYYVSQFRAAVLAATGATNLFAAAKMRLNAVMANKAGILQMLKFAALLYGVYLIGEDIITWLQGGVSVTGGLIGRVEEWRDQINAVKETLIAIKDFLGGAGMELGEWLAKGAAIAAILFTVFTVISSIVGVISAIVSAVGLVVGVIGGPLTLVVLAVGAAIAAIIYYWDDIKAAGAAAGQWIKSVWDGAINGIISMIDGIISKWNSFKGMISAGVNFIMGASSKVPSAAGGGTTSQVNNITVNGARNPARAAAATVNGIRPVPRLSGVR
nr:MAG TPA: tail tape measure [Caudoviricetes sp.]